jgi:hypothetical protein
VKVSVSQGEAKLDCQALGTGYHLISENEWLTIAENIIKVSANDIDEATSGLQLSVGENSNLSFILSNDEEVYELVGGIGEWTDRIISVSAVPTPALGADLKDFDFAPPYYLTSENGVGKILTGLSENRTGSLAAFVRGETGIYGLDLTHSPIEASETIGFRCAK